MVIDVIGAAKLLREASRSAPLLECCHGCHPNPCEHARRSLPSKAFQVVEAWLFSNKNVPSNQVFSGKTRRFASCCWETPWDLGVFWPRKWLGVGLGVRAGMLESMLTQLGQLLMPEVLKENNTNPWNISYNFSWSVSGVVQISQVDMTILRWMKISWNHATNTKMVSKHIHVNPGCAEKPFAPETTRPWRSWVDIVDQLLIQTKQRPP